jgi:hypothetical protein
MQTKVGSIYYLEILNKLNWAFGVWRVRCRRRWQRRRRGVLESANRGFSLMSRRTSSDGDLMRNSSEIGEKRVKAVNLDFVDWVLAIDCWSA